MERLNKIKIRIAPVIIAAIIGGAVTLITAGIAYAAATYQVRHDDSNIKSGYTHTLTFDKASAARTGTFDLTPAKGKLYASVRQKSGKTDSNRPKYKIKHKLSSNSSYTSLNHTFSFTKNNVFSSEKLLRSVSKGKKYNVAVTKTTGNSYKSKIDVDWLLK